MSDLRLAIRALRSTPVVSVVAALSLALGIGANAAMFTLVDSLVLRTLPVRDPARLALVGAESSGAPGPGGSAWSYPIWNEIRERQVFDGALAWSNARFNLASAGQTDFADGAWVSGRFFETLGVQPMLGRTLTDADDRRGGGPDGPVAVISYNFWQRRFNGAADAVGRTIPIEGVPFTIVGIAPPEFFGTEVGRTFEVMVPFGAEPLVRGAESALDRRNMYWLSIMVRLKADQSIDTGTAALRGVQPQIRLATMPENGRPQDKDRYLKTPFLLQAAANGQSRLRSQYQRPLFTIMVVVALVLLIACANIANLLLARAAARRHELSVRVALGASRWRLARQLLAESIVLAGLGAIFGLVLASWVSRLLVRQLSTQVNTVSLDLSLDWRVVAFTVAISAATAVLFGTAPALHASAVAPMDALKEQGRGAAGGARAGVASSLVVVQVALSLVLVVAAGLFVRTFAALATRSIGFDRNGVLTVAVNTQRVTEGTVVMGGAPRPSIEAANRLALYRRVLDAVRAVPGVGSAAVSLITPVGGMVINNRVDVSDGVELPENERVASVNMITDDWFQTFGTPVLAGRDFEATDRTGSAPVAIVNQAFARKFLNGANPLGHTVSTQVPGPRGTESHEIIGVVADAVYRSLRETPPPTMFLPLEQNDQLPPFILASATVSVRAAGVPPAQLTRSIAAAIAGVSPQLTLTFRLLADQVNASLTQERLIAILSGFFGVLALLLAGLGLYGVTSYAVTRRRNEIGIRMALGAAPGSVVRLVLSRVTLLVGAGVVCGAIASVWLAQFVGTLLYGLQPRDPATLVAAAGTLALVGALAGWAPAYRASRIDPAEVLRDT